ncbi:MAG: hypothetical protein ACI4V1_00350 [Eubacteriales bacterium]
MENFSEKKRSLSAGFLLPENYAVRDRLSRERLMSISKMLLGTEEITERASFRMQVSPEENPVPYIQMKESDYYSVNFRYARIFDLCRVLGVSHLYDIGCQTVNQSFLLAKYSAMHYTGITNGDFILNNYRPADMEEKVYTILSTSQTPPPLCDGRIRFVRGNYPEMELGIAPNNIAIASYTFTMCRDEDSIKNIAAALVRDFDRFLFNVDVGCLETWKQLDWHGTQFFPIGPQWFVFGTKIPSDVEKIKAAYPFEDGHFETGIDDAVSHWRCEEGPRAISISGREYSVYADWS